MSLVNLTIDLMRSRIKEPIGIDSDECALHKAQFGNCKGCEFAVGCCKLAAVSIILKLGSLFSMGKPEEQIRLTAIRSAKVTQSVLAAATEDETRQLCLDFLDSLEAEV